MAKRRARGTDWIGLACQLAGVVVLLSLISPQVRQLVSAVGIIVLFLLGLAVVGLIGLGVYRSWEHAEEVERNIDWPTFDVDVPRVETRPKTAPEFIQQLRNIDWFQFEKVVALVYRKLGYNVTRSGGANPDGGIDLVIEMNGERSAVQCKQWKKWNVGVKAVREFLGALTDAGIQKGIFITLRGYSGEAKQLAEKHGIQIINEAGLAKMLEETNANYDPEALSILHDTRKVCAKCESEMVLRLANKGRGAGKQFWGCSTYPRCKFTMPI